MAGKKRKSAVWEYFEQPATVTVNDKEVKKVKCLLCGILLADGGGTTNLAHHLQAQHPEEYKKSDNNAKKTKQTNLHSFSRVCSPERAVSITNHIAEVIARDLRPINSVDGQGFVRLLNYLEPGYQVLSRPHVTKMCRQIFDSYKKELIAKLDSPNVSLTTDIWTSRVQQAYLTVTVHFITEQWVMESKVLLTREMPEHHTGINIAERLKEAVRERHITPEKVVAVVRDNAAKYGISFSYYW